jgi:hypothetical protein
MGDGAGAARGDEKPILVSGAANGKAAKKKRPTINQNEKPRGRSQLNIDALPVAHPKDS